LYSPSYAKNYAKLHDIRARHTEWQKYRDAIAAGKSVSKPSVKPVSKSDMSFYTDFMTGDAAPDSHTSAMQYGVKKETLRGRSREVQPLVRAKREWGAFDAGKTKVKPSMPRPDDAKIQELLAANKRTATGFRKFFKSPHMEEFFSGSPQGQADDFMAQIRGMADQGSGKAVADAQAKSQKLLALADKLEKRPGGKALADSIRNTAARSAERAADPTAAPLGRSKLFRPKQFETFIPTVHHGGAMGSGADPLMHAMGNLPDAVQSEVAARKGIGLSSLRKTIEENAQNLAADRDYVKKNPWSIYRPEFGRVKGDQAVTDSIFNASAHDGSRMRPTDMPGVAAYGPGGPRGTTWMRWTKGVNPDKFHKQLVNEVGQSYASTNAIGAGAKQVLGLNMLQGLLHKIPGFKPGSGTCWGHHCGSMPAQIYTGTGHRASTLAPHNVLPGTMLLDDGVQIVGVQNKARVIRDLFRRTMPKRVALGLGAIGLMGAAGYGTANVAQNALSSAPPQPAPIAPPAPAPSMLPGFNDLKKYAPAAAVGAGSLAALAAAHSWSKSRRKKKQEELLNPMPA
jgi:hypothetical protein